MSAFQESRFLGISPRAFGLGIVAAAVVIGLFFIPETLKTLFDPKAKVAKERLVPSAKQPQRSQPSDQSARANMAPDALRAVNSDVMGGASSKKDVTASASIRNPKKGSDGDETKAQGGIFSGWNFQVKAAGSGANSNMSVPANLSFEKVLSKEGANFFRQSRASIPRFIKHEGLEGSSAKEAIEPFFNEVSGVASGATAKSEKLDEVGNRLRSTHLAAIRGLRRAGADRGVLMRWLQLPVVQFVDQQGGVFAGRRIRAAFAPSLILTDVDVRQSRQRNRWIGGGQPANFKGEITIASSDVQRVVIYSNGKMVRSYSLSRSRSNVPRSVRLQGDAYGIWTVVAYDTFGAKPFSKSYSFYPRAQVFNQDGNGAYRIAFLPGSAANSLDKFFFVGGSNQSVSRDSMVSRF